MCENEKMNEERIHRAVVCAKKKGIEENIYRGPLVGACRARGNTNQFTKKALASFLCHRTLGFP